MLLLIANQLALAETAPQYSNIADDEHVIFFNVDAFRHTQQANVWQIPIHGWVYEPEQSYLRKNAVAMLIKKKYNLEVTEASRPLFDRRVNLFLADNERNKRLVGQFAGQTYRSELSAANGHFYAGVEVADAALKDIPDTGVIEFCAQLKAGDTRQFCGRVRLIEPQGVSIISDIDDTVKITEVTDRKKMVENTFYKPFVAVPGMAERYTAWSRQNIPVHFVSSSPWYLYSELDSFLRRAGFPPASLSLKYFRFRDHSFLNLFKAGDVTKPPQINQILTQYPQRKFVLIGDSGEQDPEVYAGIKRQHPEQIRGIWIRNVTGEHLTNPRFKKITGRLGGEQINLFDTAEELPTTWDF